MRFLVKQRLINQCYNKIIKENYYGFDLSCYLKSPRTNSQDIKLVFCNDERYKVIKTKNRKLAVLENLNHFCLSLVKLDFPGNIFISRKNIKIYLICG